MWHRFWTSRWCVPALVLLGMLLMAPAMNIGFVADDYIHWSIMTGQMHNAQPGSHWGLFTFFDGDPAHNQALKDSGRLIWWGSNDLRLSFWRPLSEMSLWLDYRFWPDSPLLMHVHNLLWYGLLVYMLSRLYRQLDPDADPAVSRLATWLFAGNVMHVFAVAWLSARNQMISGVLLALSLCAFHAWRQGRGVKHAWWAAVTLAVGLLTAEAAIATVGYMVAYVVTMERGRSLWSRALALLPFVLIVLVWKAVHSHMGYGSFASPAYIDPASHLPRFAQSLVLRLPALMMAQWFGASTGVFEQLPHPTQVAYAVTAIVVLSGLGLLIHRLGALVSPLARFYLLGSLFVLVPACATLTMDRLVLNSNIGMSGFLAIVLCHVWVRRDQFKGWLLGGAKWVLYAMAAIHLVLFPVASLASSVLLKGLLWPTTVGEPTSLPDARQLKAAHLILVNPPAAELVYYYPLARTFAGMANPQSMQALATGNKAMTLTRVDEATLDLALPEGIKSTMARDEVTQPFKVGDTATMGAIHVEVLAVTTPGQLPSKVRFHFPASMNDPQWQFYAWKDAGYAPFELPAVGQSVHLDAVDLGKMVAGRLKGK